MWASGWNAKLQGTIFIRVAWYAKRDGAGDIDVASVEVKAVAHS